MENNYDTDEEFDEETEIEPIKSLPPPDTTPDSPPPPPVPAPATVSSKKKKVEPFVWKEDMVYYLINKWQGEPVLYNIKDPEYHDKNKRSVALERIWDSMSFMEFQPLPSKEQNRRKRKRKF